MISTNIRDYLLNPINELNHKLTKSYIKMIKEPKAHLVKKLNIILSESWECFPIPKEIDDFVVFIHEDEFYKKREQIIALERRIDLKVINEGYPANNMNINKIHRYNKIEKVSIEESLLTVKRAIKDYQSIIERLTHNIQNGNNSEETKKQLKAAEDNILKLKVLIELKDDPENQIILNNFHRKKCYFQSQINFYNNIKGIYQKKVFHISPKRLNIFIVEQNRDMNKVDYANLLKQYERIDLLNAKNDIYIPKSTLELPGK